MQGQGIENTESKTKERRLYGLLCSHRGSHTLSDIDGIKAVLLPAVEG